MSKSRIDIVGQNGNEGEHYEETDKPVESSDWEALDFLEGQDFGDIDPASYQISEDDGCEGGGCKI